jgi:hypothetical protein
MADRCFLFIVAPSKYIVLPLIRRLRGLADHMVPSKPRKIAIFSLAGDSLTSSTDDCSDHIRKNTGSKADCVATSRYLRRRKSLVGNVLRIVVSESPIQGLVEWEDIVCALRADPNWTFIHEIYRDTTATPRPEANMREPEHRRVP